MKYSEDFLMLAPRIKKVSKVHQSILKTVMIPSSSSGLEGQSVDLIRKVVGSNPTLVRVFLCPCVGPILILGLISDGVIGYENFTVVSGHTRTWNHYSHMLLKDNS